MFNVHASSCTIIHLNRNIKKITKWNWWVDLFQLEMLDISKIFPLADWLKIDLIANRKTAQNSDLFQITKRDKNIRIHCTDRRLTKISVFVPGRE